eukprot:3331188-Rhodomonas_salina.1
MSRTHAPFTIPSKIMQHIDGSAAKAFISFSEADIFTPCGILVGSTRRQVFGPRQVDKREKRRWTA